MKMKFCSQKKEMLLFVTTNMAAVTSRANRQIRLRNSSKQTEIYAWEPDVHKGPKSSITIEMLKLIQFFLINKEQQKNTRPI